MDSYLLPWHMVLGTTDEAALLYDFSRPDWVEFGVWLGTGPFDDSCFGVRVQFNKASPQFHKASPPFLKGHSMTWGFQVPQQVSPHEMILRLALAKSPPRPEMISYKLAEHRKVPRTF
eukprot:2767435-Rhodomonas_salina.1